MCPATDMPCQKKGCDISICMVTSLGRPHHGRRCLEEQPNGTQRLEVQTETSSLLALAVAVLPLRHNCPAVPRQHMDW